MNIAYSKWIKRSIAFSSDVTVTALAWIIASWLASMNILESISQLTLFDVIFIQSGFYIVCGMYRGVWRFASIPDLIRIFRAVGYASIAIIIYFSVVHQYVPVKIYINYLIFLLAMLAGSRLLFRLYRDYPNFALHDKRVLVVGAGSAGEGLIRDLYRCKLANRYHPVACVDDNTSRHGSDVHGVRVIGACKDIPSITKQHNIDLILIAIPSSSSKRMREIVSYCENSKIPFRTLPGLKDITDGIVKINSLREVLLEDLLGREQVDHDGSAIKKNIENKVIMVTGGGGSIGSELCRQIIHLAPTELVIIDNCEFNLYNIDMELKKINAGIKVHAYLASVTDKLAMEKIFKHHLPSLVFHVAAYKHVPLLETQARIAIYNNIVGTRVVADMANTYLVKSFVLISTDKAVNPSSIMGATKRASEIFCQNLNLLSDTRFITVRFGNVLDSAGSVIPLFRKQIAVGGPITVTHPEITRYFMTIPEAAQLILQATIMTDQAEIFVLDMGDPINIRYLAEQMIKLSNKVVGKDIEIVYTGLRPGEKLYEELFHMNEHISTTTHPKIMQARVRYYDWQTLVTQFDMLERAYKNGDEHKSMQILCGLVPEYNSGTIVELHQPFEKPTLTYESATTLN
jgi:FlaA1/EpsC-like NDP-sugar epimerase